MPVLHRGRSARLDAPNGAHVGASTPRIGADERRDVSKRVPVHRIGAVARFLHIGTRIPISPSPPHPSTGAIHDESRRSITLAALLALSALPSLAQTAAPAAAEPDFTFTGNLGIFSDYRFRGISQTNKKPAIQGGVDFAHEERHLPGQLELQRRQRHVQRREHRDGLLRRLEDHLRATSASTSARIYYYYPGSGANPGCVQDRQRRAVHRRQLGPALAEVLLRGDRLLRRRRTRKGAYYVDARGAHDFGNGFGVNVAIGYQGGLKSGAVRHQIDGQRVLQHHRLQARRHLHHRRLGARPGLRVHQPRPDRSAPRPTNNRNISNGTGAGVGQQELLSNRTTKES